MKKMLLGVSILSTLAFGASNPGDSISQATSGTAAVGVPMEVRVEILPASDKLVLVDENNKLIDKLIFDHGKLVKGAAITDSTVEKIVKLKRADGQALGNYKVTFKAKNSSGTQVNMTTPLKLEPHGVSSGNAIDSNLLPITPSKSISLGNSGFSTTVSFAVLRTDGLLSCIAE